MADATGPDPREMEAGKAGQSRSIMSASYRGSVRDAVYLTWYHLIRSPGLVAIDFVVAGYMTWVGCSSLDEGLGAAAIVVTCVLFFAIAFSGLALIGFMACAVRALLVRDRTFLAENTIDLYDDSFVGRNEYATSEFKWDIVRKLRRTRHYIIASISADKAIPIPRRAFKSEEEWDSFYEFMKARCEGRAVP